MELSELLRVAMRQRRLLVPLVVVTAVISLAIGAAAGNDYVASGTVGLVGPSQSLDAPAQSAGQPAAAEASAVNPYLTFSSSLPVTAVALARRVQAFHARVTLADAGLSTDYAVFSSPSSPLLQIEATARSSEEASATLARIIAIAEEELTRLQFERDAPEGQYITLDLLEESPEAAPDSAAAMKTRLTVLGVGLMFSIAIAFAVEGLRQSRQASAGDPARRSRRPAGPDGPARPPATPRPDAPRHAAARQPAHR